MYRIFAQLAAALVPTQSAQRTEEIDVDADSSRHSDGMDTETWPDVSDVSDQEDGDVAEEDEDTEAGSGAEEAEVCVTCCAETTIPTDPIAAGCGHERRMCAGCVRRHIHEELRGKGQVTRIPCPMAAGGECGAILGYHDVQRQASPEDFEFYDRLLTTRALEAMPEFIWCAASGCGSGQLHTDMQRFPIVRCHSCQGRTCFTHRCAWHAGRTCAQYDADARHSEEVALLQALERSDVKRCPRCQHGIEKNAGCDHMTCRTSAGGCGHEFCWLCLADYAAIRREGNTAHKPTCRYHC